MKLNNCSSGVCSNYDCDYCPKCSHSLYFGQGEDENGKTWKWEFNARFGPFFLRKDDEPLKNQPNEDSPAWGPFERWHENFK